MTSVGLISLEPWDEVWRRNQFLVHELLRQGAVDRVVFVDPPTVDGRARGTRTVAPGLTVVSPRLRVPKRLGGLWQLGQQLRRGPLRGLDLLWVNDPTLGVHCLQPGQQAVYDVTDDWRWVDQPYRLWRRTVRAEDVLAVRARTVVCSQVLQARWRHRYDVDAAVVHNGVDEQAWAAAVPRDGLPGEAPRVAYVGTLHEQRLDVDLVVRLADDSRIGSVHLLGPDALAPGARQVLDAHARVHLHPPVAPTDVPSWTLGFDVLVCPHLVTPFTMSLDAIKSYEYMTSGLPVVATPTSGFQLLAHEDLELAEAPVFVEAVVRAAARPRRPVDTGRFGWSSRAAEFARAVGLVDA